MGVKFANPNVSLSKLFCDKLSFTIGYKSSSEQAHIASAGNELLAMKGSLPYNRRPYKKGVRIYSGDYPSSVRMLIQWAPNKPDKSFLRVDFNPAYADMDDVWTKLDIILPGGIDDYQTKSTITRFDATVDIYGYTPAELFASYPSMSITKLECKSGEIESLYLGSAEASKRIVIYDKMRHIKEMKKKYHLSLPFPKCPTTRVEIRITDGVHAQDLVNFANPFSKLLLRPAALMPPANNQAWKLFVALARHRGAQDALLLLNESTRKTFKAKIETAPNNWWKPTEVWKSWPTLVSNVLFLEIPNDNPLLPIKVA